MNQGETLFAQVMAHAPQRDFQRCVRKAFHLLGTFSYAGLRAAHLPGEPTRYRCVAGRYARSAVPHGFSRSSTPQYASGCQREAELADLRHFAQVLNHKARKLLDLKGSIPTFVRITDGTVHDVNILDELLPEPGSIYVMDRGYVDFERLHRFTQLQASFVVRARKNLRYRRRYSHSVDRTTGLICDKRPCLRCPRSLEGYPDPLRRIRRAAERLCS